MVSNGVKAGIGFGTIGLIAVLAVSVVTLVKVFNKDDTNGTGGTIVNNTVIKPVNQTVYVPTIVYQNQTVYVDRPVLVNNTVIKFVNQTVYVPTIIYQNETIYVDVPVPYNITVYNNTIHYLNNGSDPETIINIPSPSKSSSQPYKDAAKFIADSIDISVSPCDNFYQYACGKYNKTISFDIAEYDNRMKMAVALNTPKASDPLPLQQIKQMYKICLKDLPNMGNITANGTQIQKIVGDFQTTTGLLFPLLTRNNSFQWSNSTLNAKILGYLSGKYGVDTLVSQYVDTNWKDPQGGQPYLLYLDQPVLSYPYTYYIGQTWTLTKPSLTKRVFNTLMSFNAISKVPIDTGMLNNTVDAIVQFEYMLANNYSTDATTRWQTARSYNLITLRDFNKNFTSIDINTYMQNIAINVADGNVTNRILDQNYQISIYEPLQLQKLNAALKNGFGGTIDQSNFANYFYYRLLDANAYLFPNSYSIEEDEFLDLYKIRRPILGAPRFEKNLRLKLKKHARDVDQQTQLDCVADTIDNLQYANARIFIDVIYPPHTDARIRIKTTVGHIAESILVGMQSMIDQLSWMSRKSKTGAYSKIKNLVRNIAYPDWITDDGNLTKYYRNLDKNFMNTTDYLTMMDMLNVFNVRLAFDQLRRHNGTDRKEWNGPPGIVNAWYQPELNSISFPAGILRQPYFDPDWPASMNYGSMGVVAGHELTHGFDSSGTQWDGFGELLGWLDPTSQMYFNNMTQCVINEYSGFCPLNTSYSPNCINGQQTVGENVADNGGIHAAFLAYRNIINFNGPDPILPGDLTSLLNHDQLFFLSFAQVWCEPTPDPNREYQQILVDPHSPSKYRVLGTIQNFPAFRTAFNCPLNSASAPAQHCNVWITDVNITNDTPASNILNVPQPPSITVQNVTLYTKYSQAEAFFKAALNLSADPCNDFYNYACGAYSKRLSFYIYRDNNYEKMAKQLEQMVAPGYNGDMIQSVAINKTLDFYKKCKVVTDAVNSDSTTPPEIKNGNVVKTVLDEFKALTNYTFNLCETATQNTNSDPVTLANALAFLSIKYGTDTLVTPFVDVNAKRNPLFAANFTLYIDQNTVTYSKPYYLPGAWEAYTKVALTNNAMNLVSSYASSVGMSCPPAKLQQTIAAIVEFEHILATNFSTDETTRRDFTPWINPYNTSDVKNLATFADWPTYVNQLSTLTNVNFTSLATVNMYKLLVAEPTMLTAQNNYLTGKIDTIVKYLYYRLLLSQSQFVYYRSSTKNSYIPLYPESGHHVGQKNRKRDPFITPTIINQTEMGCAQATQDYLQYANARVFTEALYKTDAQRQYIRNETNKVISAIRNSMQAMLDDLTWITMDPGTQQGARDKIMDLQINLAYPDFILNNTQLDIYHNQLGDDFTSLDYYAQLKRLTVFNQYQNYINLTSLHIDRSNFLGPPGTVNAWYQPELNSITIPEGILQQPYFDPDWPASIKFGAMGLIVGHELTHGFDDQGVQWDGMGVLNPWMSPAASTTFKDMAKCVVDEYNNFTAITNSSYNPTHINGAQTQGENIADNGGIHSAYLSYQRWVQLNGPDPQLPDTSYAQFTQDQLFFLGFAQVWCQAAPTDEVTYKQLLVDPHSPSKFRVFGTIQNFPAFRQAFNCPVGSVYAPQDHCSVWVPKK